MEDMHTVLVCSSLRLLYTFIHFYTAQCTAFGQAGEDNNKKGRQEERKERKRRKERRRVYTKRHKYILYRSSSCTQYLESLDSLIHFDQL